MVYSRSPIDKKLRGEFVQGFMLLDQRKPCLCKGFLHYLYISVILLMIGNTVYPTIVYLLLLHSLFIVPCCS